MLDGAELYPALLRERSTSPRFAGRPEHEDGAATGTNPMCGDRVRVAIRRADAHVVEVRHETRGCAICQASADLMAEAVTGRSDDEALALANWFDSFVETGEGEAVNFDVFRPLSRHRARRRCATLPWSALRDALRVGREESE